MEPDVNIKLTLSYDGSGFHGFQKQKGGERTVQGELERALGALAGEAGETVGASRTDAGVHALGQCVSFRYAGPVPPDRVAAALNTLLPRDVTAAVSEAAPDDFHARFSTVAKTYCYVCVESPHVVPVFRGLALNLPRRLDRERVRDALGAFIGTHDFSAFANVSDTPRDPVKTIHAFELVERPPFLVFRVTGSGFLYRMVRNMAGAAIEAGAGRCDAERIRAALADRGRAPGIPTLPPQALYLVRVHYTENDVSQPVPFL